jgi:hypothetical protein
MLTYHYGFFYAKIWTFKKNFFALPYHLFIHKRKQRTK